MSKIPIALLIAAGLSASWCATEGDAALGDRIAAYVASGKSPLRMSDLTDFKWDRLHVFTPYSAWDTVESDLGFAWAEGRKLNLEQREDICLLVFVAERQVVRYVAQHRGRGDLGALYQKEGYGREDAIFRIDRSRGRPWITAEEGAG